MLRKLQARLTFANTISLIALFIALGGTGYAATLARNSVGAEQIRKNAVGAPEIKRGAVRGSEVKNRSLKAVEFKAGVLLKGDPGFGQSTVQYEVTATPLADNTSDSYTVFCPAGQQGIAGGARGDATDSEFTNVTSSRPAISSGNTGAPADGGTFAGWRATVLNPSGGAPPGGDILPEVWVVCVPAP